MIIRFLISIFLAVVLLGAFTAKAESKSPARSGLPDPDFGVLQDLDLSGLPVDIHGVRIVARVNGRPIREPRFSAALERAVKSKGMLNQMQANALKSALAAPVLDNLVRSEIILEYADKHDLTATEEEVSKVLKEANEKLPAGDKLQDQAMKRGETPESVRIDIRERLIQERVMEHIGRDVMPASPQLEADLLKAAEEYALSGEVTSATEVRARHIVFRSPADADTTTTREARARAERVLGLIRGGMDFGQAARRYSQDRTTRDLDGDLGFFAQGRMYPEFDRVAFTLKRGDISGIIETPVGLHIIQVTDRREIGIQHSYQQSERRRRFAEWLDKAAREAEVERYL